MLHPGLFPTEADRGRLRAEAEAVALLHHPNVVQLYEVGEVSGSPYLVLEYVSGGTLESRLAGRPQPPRSAAALVETLARAVHAAHLNHLVHRDLKPANILLQGGDPSASGHREGRTPPVLARDPEDRRLRAGQAARPDRLGPDPDVVGHPGLHVAGADPRRGRSAAVGLATPASDIYALGVILYEMVTGRPPFLGTDWVTTLLQVVRRAPCPPRPPARDAARPGDDLLKCLEKDPARRYATAGELADDLARFLGHEPILARPIGPLGRLAKWGRRNPAPAGSLAALVATGLVAFLVVLGQWQRADRARQVADALAGSETEQRLRAEHAVGAERWQRYRSNIAAAAAALQLQQSGPARRPSPRRPRSTATGSGAT